MKYVIGVDFGGGASKATLLSEQGKIVATANMEYPTHYPADGYAEQNPMDWYTAICRNISSLFSQSGVCSSDVKAIALDAATHTAVLCDGDFNVIMPAIYWTDTRCIQQVKQLCDNHLELIKEQALHSPDTIWTLPQLMWVRDNMPEQWSRLRHIMFAKDYVRYLLTDVYCTDYIEAQGSMLFDCNKNDFSPKLCAIAGIDEVLLPPLKAPCDIIGGVTAHAAADTGLQTGTPVLCGSTDTVMEVYASGAVAAGQMTVKMATAGRICVVTERAYPDRHLVNYSHVVDSLWYPGTATKSCAASYRWYRDTFGGDYAALDCDAAHIAVGSEGLFFHPYLNGELTPYADPKLCGSFSGIRAGHKRAHFSRAVLEGAAFSLYECMCTIDKIGIPHRDAATVIGGGAASPLWRQIVADMLGITLYCNEVSDSSFGSAMTAGVAAGFFESLQSAAQQCVRQKCVTVPDMNNHRMYMQLYPYYRRIHDALAPVYGDMR